MRGAKEDDAYSGLEDVVKVGLAELTSLCSPQHLLDDNSAKAVYDKQNRPRRIIAPTPFQGDEEVPGDITEGVLVDVRPCFVSDSGVVSICQDSGMRQSGRDQISRPIHIRSYRFLCECLFREKI